ncbi:thiamine pyrophosphate-dependent dehydrogenase E1 component subunit alpha [Anaeromyxobacter sp. K]|uniref:thiamine pyrophosphate-dependent dehydrogenase E1 component subunit alpha n=1 Tax=Anaeromyxobacter sp. (strain K) TaxID=447217 RepID=UPI00059E20B4|nr:thiamine pyrophosphate-dependent enzyme [Anaeromyxobacter sp. K]
MRSTVRPEKVEPARRPRAARVRAVPAPPPETAAPAGGGVAADGSGGWETAFPIYRVLDEHGAAEPGQATLSPEEALALHRHLVRARALDARMTALQRQGRIGFYVGAEGEEACVVGAAAAMAPQDWLFPCYREHAAALLRGLPLDAFLCNLFGNSGDLARGRQMPCHETWRPGHYASVSAPLGTQLPHAVGAAWAARLKGEDMVSLTWFGDGATSTHDFHTALGFAGVHRVPVVFLCRANGWAISTPTAMQTAAETIAQKGIAYGVHGERVDGNDLLAVHAATRRARARAAAGEGPTLLECVTYRVGPHTTSDDPRGYRDEAEVAPWRARDPLERLRVHLERTGALAPGAHAALLREADEEIRAAVARVEALPPPARESLFDDVYAEPLRQQREQRDECLAAPAGPPRDR